MAGKPSARLGVAALLVYAVGGLLLFSGLLLAWLKHDDVVFGLGSGVSIGLLLVCVGAALSILGVLLMRIFRNRGLS